MIKIRIREVIKKAKYWIFCPQCEKLRSLECLIEKPITPEMIHLSCTCGHIFAGIEKEWVFFDKRPCLLETEMAEITN